MVVGGDAARLEPVLCPSGRKAEGSQWLESTTGSAPRQQEWNGSGHPLRTERNQEVKWENLCAGFDRHPFYAILLWLLQRTTSRLAVICRCLVWSDVAGEAPT